MPAYNIPRDTSGEGKILYIFSTRALIATFIGALIGGVFYFIFNLIGLKIVGIVLIVLFGIIGFSIMTFKVPRIKGWPVTENIRRRKNRRNHQKVHKLQKKKNKNLHTIHKGGNNKWKMIKYQ